MKKPLTRTVERERSARFLNGLGPEVLWTKFGISRVAEISGLDVIGIPVWSATRPLSLSISINSGKGLSTLLARAGAIAEGIEFCYAETLRPIQTARTRAQMERWRDFQVIPPERWHLARQAVVNAYSVFDWDVVASIHEPDAVKFLIPSGAIYLGEFDRGGHLMRFQSSSNGWATGASRDDAVLQALYEVVERDGWTLWHWLMEKHEVWPSRIDFSSFEDWPFFQETANRLDEWGIKVVLFDISTDAALPCAWAVLYDLTNRPTGIFSGFGCAWTWRQAVTRALLEAIQSRACYIAGARDDLYRRSFLLLKGVDQASGYAQAMSFESERIEMPEGDPLRTAKEELAMVIGYLWERNLREFYLRDCGNPFEGNPFSVVKVVAPCLEQWRSPYWQPTERLKHFTAQYVK